MQAVADAYYVLSDPTRRKEYDNLYSTRTRRDRTADPDASSSFFSQFAGMFGGAQAGNGATPAPGARPDAEDVFADVFDEVSLSSHICNRSFMLTFCSFYAQRFSATLPGGLGEELYAARGSDSLWPMSLG